MGNLTVKESGEMVNFISPNVSKITSFKVHFSPKQEGSGDPSPDNVREITGWNGVEGYISNVAQPYSSTFNTLTATIDWTEDVGTVYGGYVDLISGELVQEWYSITFNGESVKVNRDYMNVGDKDYIKAYWVYFNPKGISDYNCKCNTLKITYNHDKTRIPQTPCLFLSGMGETFGGLILGKKEDYPELAEGTSQDRIDAVNNWFKENPTQIIYKLKTPITHQLTPQQLSTLKGQNNFWSNADYVEIEYELTETFDIQKAKRKIILNQPHVESASGDIVTFDTDMKGKLKECKVYFSPVQEGEGDPSPDNVRNITGWNGVSVAHTNKNLIRSDDPLNPNANYFNRSGSKNPIVYSNEEQAYTCLSTLDDNNGGISEMNHARINATKNDEARLFVAPKSSTYTFSIDYKNVGTSYGIRVYTVKSGVIQRIKDIHGDADGIWHTQSLSIDLDKGDSIRAYCYSDIYWRNIALIEGENMEYVENTTTEYSIDWTDSAGTVYSGYVDLVSGELVQEWYGFTADGENIKVNSSRYAQDARDIFGAGIVYNTPTGIGSNNNTRPTNIYCNKIPVVTNEKIDIPYIYTPTTGALYMVFYVGKISEHPEITSKTDTQNFVNNWLQENPLQIIYQLATPIHYQLTPQQLTALRGTNNIYSNTNGQTEIKYWKH